jgi:uncharacterized protein
MKRLILRCMFYLTLLLLAAPACTSSARVAPPVVSTSWQPPEGVEAAAPLSCEGIKSLFAYDAQAPLDIQEETRQRDGGLTVIEFNYASPLGGRVPAVLVLPDGSGPFAGLVFMHGSGGYRRSMLPTAKAYARLGAVAITIGGPSSRPKHDNLIPFTFREQDRDEQIQLILDLRRAVDVLLARPEVDPQRLAYVGVSYGGAMGGLLAAVEHRLRGYALEVGDGGLVNHFSGAKVMGLPEDVRREWLAAMWPIEPIHYVGCAAPAALLFQNGTLDTQVRPADALRYQNAGSQPKTILWYKADHGLDMQAYRDQARWLSRLIGIDSYQMAFPSQLKIVLVSWSLLTVSSLVFLSWYLWRRRPAPRGARFLWLLTTVFLGPLALAIYWISARQPADAGESGAPSSPAHSALGSAAWAAAGNLPGVIIVLALILYFPQRFGDNLIILIASLILLSVCTGWLVFWVARQLSRTDDRFSSAYRRPLLAEAPSTVLVMAGAVPTIVVLVNRFFGRWPTPFGIDLFYPPLWGVLSLACLAGAVIAYPLHRWLIRRGVIRWESGLKEQEIPTDPGLEK